MNRPGSPARLELDAPLRQPLPQADAIALVALLRGSLPPAAERPAHPLFQVAEAAQLLLGESLDHATSGSRIVQEAEGPRLLASCSLPSSGLLAAGLDWLGPLLALEAGDIAGFLVPAGSHRHDRRLLVWDGAALTPLGPGSVADGGCGAESFRRAAGLPPPAEATAAQLRRVSLAQLRPFCLPVAQAALDGPFTQGQACFRDWLIEAAEARLGLTTRLPPLGPLQGLRAA